MNPSPRTLLVTLTFAAVLLAGCAPATPLSPTPTELGQAVTPPPVAPTLTPEPEGGPGQISVSGDIETRFTPTKHKATEFAQQVTLTLFTDDLDTGVTLFLPSDLKPGHYDIADLFHLSATDLTARFDTVQDGQVVSYESLAGTLDLTSGGLIFSGDFTFTAANPPDGAKTATITGAFSGVAIVPVQ